MPRKGLIQDIATQPTHHKPTEKFRVKSNLLMFDPPPEYKGKLLFTDTLRDCVELLQNLYG